ncbi:MAG: PcfJ domain-containing protein, partial [Kiloniellales bacterium]|nr:PcfJ domain-containing protein [Kiloniellales bacterium]
EEVTRFLDGLAQQTASPELQRWLKGSARRWILKHYDLSDRILRDPATGGFVLVRPDSVDDVVPRSYEGEVPAWCASALARGDAVVVLRLGASLKGRLARVTAQLEAELKQGSLTSLERLSFERAEARLRKSRREGYTARRRKLIARGTYPVFRTVGGSEIVRLTSRESLADEGSRMHHCVGGYGYPQAVARGDCEIYSLRDREGRHRATLEVEDGQVLQVKGFANGAVGAPERVVLRAFIRRRGYEVKSDRHNLVLRRRDFRCKDQELDHRLQDGGGLALLRENRTATLRQPSHSEVKTLLCQVIANAGRLAPETLACLYEATLPDDGRILRLRRRQSFSPYGVAVHLDDVVLPLPLLNLAKFRVFRGTPWERECRALLHGAEGALTSLALVAPDRLFALGPQAGVGRLRNRPWDCPADLLADARVDVSVLRAQRHLALRRRLNQVKRRALGPRAEPAKGHLALRRLLEAPEREFVL